MKYKLTVLSLLFCLIASANDTFSYTLEKHQKFEKTFSLDAANETVHMVIVKNKDTKMYDLIPFKMNAQQEVTQLATVSFEEVPSVLAYHHNNGVVSITTHQNKMISIIDFTLEDGSVAKNSWASKEAPQINIINEGITRIIQTPDRGKTLVVTTVKNSSSVNNQEIAVPKELQKSIKTILTTNVDIVDNQSFVKNGSIGEYQGYFSNNTLYFTYFDSFLKKAPTVLSIDINTSSVSEYTLETPTLEKLSDFNAHLIDNKLFTTFQDKKDLTLQLYDANTGNTLASHALSGTLSGLKKIKSKKASFLKEIKKPKNRPTVAVNATKDGTYAITVDFVNKNTYNHHGMHWFLHQMMWQQQMMMNMGMPGGFGPKDVITEEMILNTGDVKSVPLHFVLDANFEIAQDQNSETKHQFVDKEKYGKQLAANKNVFNPSIAYVKDAYHYMYTNKKGNVVYIKSKPIKKRVRPTRK